MGRPRRHRFTGDDHDLGEVWAASIDGNQPLMACLLMEDEGRIQPGAGFCRHKTDRHEVTFAKSLFESVMQLFGRGLVVEPYLANLILAAGVLRRLASDAQKTQWLHPLIGGERRELIPVTADSFRLENRPVATRFLVTDDAEIDGEPAFVVETISVVLQVASYKLTGRRIFRMAPIHHHFELKGWPEPRIIVRFWIIAIIFALLALATLKLR